MVLREFIKNPLQFFIEPVPYIINPILGWGMDIQNNDITPVTS
jgi:hypothetical protein